SDWESRWHSVVSGEDRSWRASLGRGGLGLLAGLYELGITTYRAGFDTGLLRPTRLPCPVISIGNLTVGGTGKTTTVRWIARRLLERGLRPAILSRGYGAKSPARHTADDDEAVTVVAGPEGVRLPTSASGDEPQLLARSLPGVPVLIGKKRVLSGRHAVAEFGIDACILDDAFQYWRLEKDLEIVLVNATNPFGYGRILPRGMLREPLRALRRADAAILTHAAWADEGERDRLREQLLKWNPGLELAEARHVPVLLRDHRTGAAVELDVVRERKWLALSALGQPGAFERTLAELGAVEPASARFPDHHAYTEADLAQIADRVKQEQLAGVVTTEKDSVKIPAGWLRDTPCCVVEIDLQFLDGQERIETLLRGRTTAGSHPRGSA
ncbi:MAG TPA: tetraacyldisaccharide 4'-kinase, partial [Armatimonadota bacterium]|nr:tetraacyldisaccharide 4'-kinase [Armatimonadota bacterium]